MGFRFGPGTEKWRQENMYEPSVKLLSEMKGDRLVFMVLLFVVLVLRIAAILPGLPFSDVSDEVGAVAGTLIIGASKSLKANIEHGYTSFYNYFLAGIYAVIYGCGRLTGYFKDVYDFALLYMVNPWIFYFSARAVSCAAGLGSLLFLYRTARIVFKNGTAALVPPIVLGLSTVHLDLSSVGKVDSLMVFFAAAYIYHLAKLLLYGGGLREYLVTGALLGLATATKTNAAFLGFGLPIVILLRSSNPFFDRLKSIFSTNAFAAASAAAITFSVANPAFILSFDRAFSLAFGEQSGTKYTIFSVDGAPIPWLWVFKSLLLQEPILTAATVGAFAYGWRNWRKEYILFLSLTGLYFAYVGSWSKASLHYFLPVYPLLAVSSGSMYDGFQKWTERGRPRRAIGLSLLAAVLAFAAWNASAKVWAKTRPHTRNVAREWMERNIPGSTYIAYDDYPSGPPFFSPDTYLRSGSATKFERFVPGPLKQRIETYSRNHVSYRAIRVRYYMDKPVFPKTWTDQERGLFSKDPMMVHYYKHRFVTLEELCRKGVEYIVVSEAYFGQFSPELYTPDNPLHQCNMAGFVFFSRLFGHNGFYNRLIEFSPGKETIGPRIVVFRRTAHASPFTIGRTAHDSEKQVKGGV